MEISPTLRKQSATGRPLVSVVLPVYNAEAYIARSLESVCRQTYNDLEIIVVDDGSTDGTAKIIGKLAAADRRIVSLTKPNSGIVDALNHALAVASGQFIARQDADDISTPARIAMQVEYLTERPSCIAVSGAHFHIDESGQFTGGRYYPLNRGSGDYTAYPALEPYLPHPFLMMRAAVLKELKYRHTFHCEDSDLYWRAVRYGRLENMSDIVGLYRIHTGSISGTSVMEGRIQAVYSQLAAISAARYDLMMPDIEFDPALLTRCRTEKTLSGIIEIFEPMLTPHEQRYLRSASALKLVELSRFRPYRLEKDDVRYLKEHVKTNALPDRENRRAVRRALRGYYRKQGLLQLMAFYAGF